MRILLTGGTGLLGRDLVPRLRRWATDVDVLSRGAHGEWRCDLSQWDGGIPAERLGSLRGRYDFMVHLAALYDLRGGWADAYQNTVQATHTALTLATKLDIPNLLHVSTVAVAAGDDRSAVGRRYPPERLSIRRPFPDSYAYSKAQAESMVRSWMSGIPSRTICRLGIIVGDTQGNAPVRLDGPYLAVKGIDRVRHLLSAAPGPIPLVGCEQSNLPLVPIDVASNALDQIVRLRADASPLGVSCLHLTPRQGIGLREFYRNVLDRLGLAHRRFIFVDSLPEGLRNRLVELAVGIPREELAYSLSLPAFDSDSTVALLGRDWCPEFAEYQEAFWKGYQSYAENS